jgi:DNA-binding IclR family transcriptional regulator
MSAERKAVLQALEGAGKPLGPKALADATGIKVESLRTILTRMVQGGQVRKPGRGLYAME